MRIASISKSLTMVALAKLWEAGKLDLDVPVQHYVPEFPEKEYEGEKVVKFTVHFTNGVGIFVKFEGKDLYLTFLQQQLKMHTITEAFIQGYGLVITV
jgi:hypothetical protein